MAVSGTGCNISKYIPTRRHSSRMRTTRLPTVTHCIPGPMSRVWVPNPPPGHTHHPHGDTPSNTWLPRKDLLPEIPLWRDLVLEIPPRKDLVPQIPIPPPTPTQKGHATRDTPVDRMTDRHLWKYDLPLPSLVRVNKGNRPKLGLNFWLEEYKPWMILEALSDCPNHRLNITAMWQVSGTPNHLFMYRLL